MVPLKDNWMPTHPIRMPPPFYHGGHRHPDLAKLIDAWPTLPEPLKAGIRAMVEAAIVTQE